MSSNFAVFLLFLVAAIIVANARSTADPPHAAADNEAHSSPAPAPAGNEAQSSSAPAAADNNEAQSGEEPSASAENKPQSEPPAAADNKNQSVEEPPAAADHEAQSSPAPAAVGNEPQSAEDQSAEQPPAAADNNEPQSSPPPAAADNNEAQSSPAPAADGNNEAQSYPAPAAAGNQSQSSPPPAAAVNETQQLAHGLQYLDLLRCVLEKTPKLHLLLDGFLSPALCNNRSLESVKEALTAGFEQLKHLKMNDLDLPTQLVNGAVECVSGGVDNSACCSNASVPDACLPLCGHKGSLAANELDLHSLVLVCGPHKKALEKCVVNNNPKASALLESVVGP